MVQNLHPRTPRAGLQAEGLIGPLVQLQHLYDLGAVLAGHDGVAVVNENPRNRERVGIVHAKVGLNGGGDLVKLGRVFNWFFNVYFEISVG